jgi:hypothetical protein
MSNEIIALSIRTGKMDDIYTAGYGLTVLAGGIYTAWVFARDEMKASGDRVSVGGLVKSAASGLVVGSFMWSILGLAWPLSTPWAIAELTVFNMTIKNPLK